MDRSQLLEAMRTAFQRHADEIIWCNNPERGIACALELLCRAVLHLRHEIPGLDIPTLDAVRDIDERLYRANAALSHEQHHLVLMEVLRGMVLRPNHAGLFFMVARVCEARNDVRKSALFLDHVLWINPGHREAQLLLQTIEQRMGKPAISTGQHS